MNKITSVIFDMDGVIFNTERLYLESCIEVGEKHELEKVEEACRKCIGITSAESDKIMKEYFGDKVPVDIYKEEVYKRFCEKFGDGKWLIKTGARELLDYLKTNGYKLALASSTQKEGVTRELRDAGLIDFFDELVCGDMVKKSKPEPDIFLEAASRIDSSPEECLVIEDSFNGIRAAYSAGIRAIMVPDLLEPDDEMKEKAWKILPSLVEVKELIEKRYENGSKR